MKEYNDKAFLLPGSINSCALYHAKILENGEYMFRIHDCITGIRLRGELNTDKGLEDAIEKTITLIEGLEKFRTELFSRVEQKILAKADSES